MTTADKLITIAENEQKIYDKGYSQSESDFWDAVQNNGSRYNYEYGFQYWNCKELKPKYQVKPTKSYRTANMFAYNTVLEEIKKDYFDLSRYTPATAAASSSSNYYTFYGCSELKVIEDIGIQGGGYEHTFAACTKLHTIELMRCVADGNYITPFGSCNALKNLTIEGEIGKNFPIPNSSKLSTASIVSIIEHLSQDVTGQTLTLNTTAVNNMVFPYTSPYTNITYNSWDELIATKSNWTISTTTA